MKQHLPCKNTRYAHLNYYGTRYNGYCLECSNAGVDELKDEIERLRDVLASVEWAGHMDMVGAVCPSCESDMRGHRKDCPLAAALRPAEWVTENERTVKWDKEQTAYLRKKLAEQATSPGAEKSPQPSEPGPVCERCGDTGCPACTIREFQAAGAEVHLLTPEGVVPPADKAVWKCLRPECGKTFDKFPFSQLCPACNAACAKVTTPTDPKPCADPICDCQGLAAETKAADPNRGRVVIEELRRWPSKGYDEEERANAIYDAVAADLAKRKR